MSKVQKACRICGKRFTPCADCAADNTMFRWRRFLCSFECAKDYFARLEEAREQKQPAGGSADSITASSEPPADLHATESAASQHKSGAGNAFISVSPKIE